MSQFPCHAIHCTFHCIPSYSFMLNQFPVAILFLHFFFIWFIFDHRLCYSFLSTDEDQLMKIKLFTFLCGGVWIHSPKLKDIRPFYLICLQKVPVRSELFFGDWLIRERVFGFSESSWMLLFSLPLIF